MKNLKNTLKGLARTALLLACLPTATPAQNGHPHERTGCKSCHFKAKERPERPATLGLMASTATGPALPPREAECVRCHTATDQGLAAELGFHRTGGRTCTHCHAYHEPGVTVGPAAGIDLSIVPRVDIGHCRSCHGQKSPLSELSDGHRRAAEFYHGDAGSLVDLSPSQGCLQCHSRTAGNHWQARSGSASAAIPEHSSHPVGVDVVPGAGRDAAYIRPDLDPRVPLFGGKMECQSCHSLTSGTEDLLIAFPRKYDICLACHRTTGPGSDIVTTMAGPVKGNE